MVFAPPSPLGVATQNNSNRAAHIKKRLKVETNPRPVSYRSTATRAATVRRILNIAPPSGSAPK